MYGKYVRGMEDKYKKKGREKWYRGYETGEKVKLEGKIPWRVRKRRS